MFGNFDNSIPMFSPRGGEVHNIKKKRNTAKSPSPNPFSSTTNPNLTQNPVRLAATTIGFMCRDENIVCEDFKSEMEKISNEKSILQQQKLIKEQEEQRRFLIDEQERVLKVKAEEKEKQEEGNIDSNGERKDGIDTGRSSRKKKQYNYERHLKLGNLSLKSYI